MQIKLTDGQDKDFIQLCHALDRFLNELVGGEENRAQYIPYNALDDIHDVLVAYENNIPIGCASFKRYDDKNAEVKRVFVKEEYRGKHIGLQLMKSLEQIARIRDILISFWNPVNRLSLPCGFTDHLDMR